MVRKIAHLVKVEVDGEVMNLSNLKPAKGSRQGPQTRRARAPAPGCRRRPAAATRGSSQGAGYHPQARLRGRPDAPRPPRAQARLHQHLPDRIHRVSTWSGLAKIAKAEVEPQDLVAAGLIKNGPDLVKILGRGELAAAKTVHAHKFSGVGPGKIEAKPAAKPSLIGNSHEHAGQRPQHLQHPRAAQAGHLHPGSSWPSTGSAARSRTPGISASAAGRVLGSPEGHHPRLHRPVLGPLHVADDDLRPGHHALHQLLDHPPAARRSSGPTSSGCPRKASSGRKKITQYTRYGTIGICIIQAWASPSSWRASRAPAGRPSCPARRLAVPAADRPDPDHGHGLRHVAGRADHRARHRQRDLAHHLRRHRRPLPVRPEQHASPASRRGTMGSAQADLPGRADAGRHRLHRLRRARPAAHPGVLRQARRRPQGLRRPEHAPAAAGQHRRRHPDHLRRLDHHLPRDHRPDDQGPGPPDGRPAVRHGHAPLQPLLRRGHHLLHLLLHLDHLQPGRRGRQPAEVRRVHPGHPAGQEHVRLHRRHPVADHARRRRLPGAASPSCPSS